MMAYSEMAGIFLESELLPYEDAAADYSRADQIRSCRG